MNLGILRLITLALTFVGTAMVFAKDAKEEAVEYPEVDKFVGIWKGDFEIIFEESTFSMPIILDIEQQQGREVEVLMEWPRRRNARTSGVGVITPNSVSWVVIEQTSGGGLDLFGRYLARISEDGKLVGVSYLEQTLEKGGSFTLDRVGLQEIKELEEFKNTNSEILKRLELASDRRGFLNPSWRKLLPSVLAWLDATLGQDFKTINKQISPDREYANRLAAALANGENLFAKHLGTPIPMRLPESLRQSSHIQNYELTLPAGFPGDGKNYPLRIQLGGGSRRLHHKPVKNPTDQPFIVVRPVGNSNPDSKSDHLNTLFAGIKNILPVDEERVYLYGSSSGGMSAYRWAMNTPEHFAAMAAISARGDVFRASRLKNIPIWIFHGIKAKTLSIDHAETMLAALKECGANVKYTFYPEGKHNIHGLMDYPALYAWFLDHKRSKEQIPDDPIDYLGIKTDGIGEKVFYTIPKKRIASIQSPSSDMEYKPHSSLYKVFQNAGVRTSSIVQEQILPSLPDDKINLLLELPADLEPKELPDGVKIMEFPSSRALMFAAIDNNKGSLDRFIKLALKELKQNGQTPTGEIRKTRLKDSYPDKSVTKVDIILK